MKDLLKRDLNDVKNGLNSLGSIREKLINKIKTMNKYIDIEMLEVKRETK